MKLETLQKYFDTHGPSLAFEQNEESRWRSDANESLVFARQLQYVYTREYNAKYPALKARTMIPVNTEGGDNESFLYRGYQMVGQAKFIDDKSHDFPRVSVNGAEQAGVYQSFGASWDFSDDQLGRSRLLGRQLDVVKADAARLACDQFLDKIAVVGGGGLYGIANAPGVSSVSGLNGDWNDPATTNDEIVADIAKATGEIVIGSQGNVLRSQLTLALPLEAFQALDDRQVSQYDTRTLAQWLTATGRVGAIEPWVALDTAGSGSAPLGVLYLRDPDTLELMIPKDFEQSTPHRRGFFTEVFCKVKTGGVDVHRPSNVRHMAGLVA